MPPQAKGKKFANRVHELLDAALGVDDPIAVASLLDGGLVQPEKVIYQSQNALMLAMASNAGRCVELLASRFRIEKASDDTRARTIALARFHGHERIGKTLALLIANKKNSGVDSLQLPRRNAQGSADINELSKLKLALCEDDAVAVAALLEANANLRSDVLGNGQTALAMAMNAIAPSCISVLLEHVNAMPDGARSITLSIAKDTQNFVVFERLMLSEKNKLNNDNANLSKQLARVEESVKSLAEMVLKMAQSVSRLEEAGQNGSTPKTQPCVDDQQNKPAHLAEGFQIDERKAIAEDHEATEKLRERERDSNYEDFRASLRKLRRPDHQSSSGKIATNQDSPPLETLGIKASEARERVAEASSTLPEKPKLRAERQT